jgi:translation initiation factor IF-2
MNKRVHQIAKERGLASKDVLERLRAAGIDVKAASSNVDEDVAIKILGNGDGAAATVAPPAAKPPRAPNPVAKTAPTPPKTPEATMATPAVQAPPRPAAQAPAPPPAAAPSAQDGGAKSSVEPRARVDHKQRPTRDSLQGERAPGQPEVGGAS